MFYRIVTRPTFWTPFVPIREAAKLAEAEGMIIKRDITVTTPPRHGAVGRGRPIHPFGCGRRPWGAPPKQILVEVKLSKTIARPSLRCVGSRLYRTDRFRPSVVRVRPSSEAIAPLIQQREAPPAPAVPQVRAPALLASRDCDEKTYNLGNSPSPQIDRVSRSLSLSP